MALVRPPGPLPQSSTHCPAHKSRVKKESAGPDVKASASAAHSVGPNPGTKEKHETRDLGAGATPRWSPVGPQAMGHLLENRGPEVIPLVDGPWPEGPWPEGPWPEGPRDYLGS